VTTVDPSLSNRDLVPTVPAQRTWGTYNYIALWFSMSMEITTYQLASSLIAKGMDWKQAVLTVLLGNLIVLVPCCSTPTRAQSTAFRFLSSFAPLWRARLPICRDPSCRCSLRMVWHSVVGSGELRFTPCSPSSGLPLPLRTDFCGLLPWFLVAQHDRRLARRRVHPPFAGFRCGRSCCHGRSSAHLGTHQGRQLRNHALHAQPVHSTSQFLAVFFPSLTAMVGYWATLALNIPDFTRYSKSQTAQAWGQAFGLPVAMTLYTFVGISVTSASAVLFGKPIWNPIVLIARFISL